MIKSMSSRFVGITFAILGVVLFSAKAVMVKLAYNFDVDYTSLLLFRMVFALPFYLGIIFLNRPLKTSDKRAKDYFWLVFFGFVGYYLASLFDFIGLQYLKAGLERIILFIYPTLVVFFTWLFFRKKITQIQKAAILVTYFGVIVTFWNEIGITGDTIIWGAFLIFLSAVTYALYLVGSGWLIPKFGVLLFTSYAMVIATLCISIHYCFVGDFNLFNYPKEVYFLGIAMAIFSTLLPSFLVSAAIERLGASTFSIFGSLGPVSTIILAFFFLNEKITGIQILGMSIVLAGVSLISYKKNKKVA